MRKYQICRNCVMDTSDSNIYFDKTGLCDHCIDFYKNTLPKWNKDLGDNESFLRIIDKIKKEGKKNDFDCILGMSGGVDSSYMLHYAVTELGLKPLVFHVDGGWNSELAVHNIQVLVDKLNLDLYTEVIDWNEMRDFQLAFFKSGLPYLDIPQDHAFVATLYKFAKKYKVKYILNGGNVSTECVQNPKEWIYYGTDMALIDDIKNKFCKNPMKTYPFSSVLNHKFYLRYILGIKVFKLLNYINYEKFKAISLLESKYGWKPYPQKHFESRFTKFYEGYWLPTRFGFDTRRVQLSSLILTNQINREDALKILSTPSYSHDLINDDFSYIASKLEISINELKSYYEMPLKYYWDYNNNQQLFDYGAKILKLLGIEKSIKR